MWGDRETAVWAGNFCKLGGGWTGLAPFHRGWKPLPQGSTLSGGLCPPYILAKPSGTGGRVVCETKRIRSHYLLLDARKASGAFHRPSAERQGLSVRYQCCDYAPLWSGPPCPAPFNREVPTRESPRPSRRHLGLLRADSSNRRRCAWRWGLNPPVYSPPFFTVTKKV